MDAEIINVGMEMLIGDTINNCQALLVPELANIDVNVCCTNTAGYDPQKLRSLLSTALTRSDVIIIVGGMGSSAEDITKQTVCMALGLALVPHAASSQRIKEYCSENGVTITPEIMAMADMPAGSVVFRNDNGMCPGCAIRSASQCIVMLPSSTVEMAPMVKNYVSQYLKQLIDGAVFSQVINIFYLGATLRDVEERLGHLLNSPNPTVRCVEMTGEIRVRVTAKTASEQASREIAAPVIRQILDLFGSDAYGMNTVGIEEVVVRELKDRKMTLSTAESCTAGIISKRVTDIPGASRVFEMGAATYSSNKKSDMLGVSDKIIQRYGAVSPEAAAAMAVGARRLAGSTLAVSTTGIAGPGGGTPLKPVGLVYIALADKENVWIRKTLIQKPGMDRDYVRQVAASHALNLVRLYCSYLPYLMPGYEPLGEGVRESYFNENTVMSPQAIKALAASVPVAALGIGNTTATASAMQPGSQPSQYSYSSALQAARMMQSQQNNQPVMPAQPIQSSQPIQPAQPVMPSYPQAPAKKKVNDGGQGVKHGQSYPARSQSYTAKSAPNKKNNAKASDVVQRVVFFVALLVMLGAGGYLLYDLVILPQLVESSFNEYRDVYESTVNSAQGGIWSDDGSGTVIDDLPRREDGTLESFAELVDMNSDIIGWITVPGTVIDYPVTQYKDDGAYTEEHGEYYYLHKNIKKEYDKNGTIFADYRCIFGRDILPRSTILYGHHMKNGTMFQNLLKYDVYSNKSNLDFYKQNPVIRFDTKYNPGQWVIFAIVKADGRVRTPDSFTWTRSIFENDQDFSNFIDDVRARSLIDTYSAIDVNYTDKLLVLQTCSYEREEARTLIVARRVRDNEGDINVSSVTVAANPVMPSAW